MKSICVFCGSSDWVHQDYLAAARRTGRVLAERKVRLVYGGGRTGLMGAVAEGALEAGGEVTGVMVTSMNTAALAHPGLTHMDVTPGPHQRKARMHELADGYLALPGGIGTFDELFEAMAWAQAGEHEKPVGMLNVRNYFDPLMAAIDHAVAEGFILPEHRAVLYCDPDLERLLDTMASYVHPRDAMKKWMRQD